MTKINQNQLSFFSVNCLKVPGDEGPKSIPVSLDFTANTELDLDLQNIVDRKYITMVQAVFLDNSAGGTSLSIKCTNTNQTLTIPPFSQGYLMFLCPNPPRISFLSGSGAVLSAQLMNFPVVNCVWSTIN